MVEELPVQVEELLNRRIVSGISLKHFEILHRILKMSILLLINYSHSSYRTNKATVLNLPFNELRKYIGKGGLVS